MSHVQILPGYQLYVKGNRMWGVKVNGQTLCQSWGYVGRLPRSSCKYCMKDDADELMETLIRKHLENGYEPMQHSVSQKR